MIWCCKDCVAPKRYPGCHDHCPEYLAQKEKHDKERIAQAKLNDIERRERARGRAAKLAMQRRNQYKD